MTTANQDLGSMSCAELLKELARLAAMSDDLNAEVGGLTQAAPEQEPQVAHLVEQRQRMDRITELIKARGCS